MENAIVCRCEEVARRDIVEAIKDGATTVDGVKRRTRACMGLCQGRTCRRLVAQIIAEKTGVTLSEVEIGSVRPPVRPVRISDLTQEV